MTKYKKKESTLNRVAKTARNVGSAIVVANKAFKIARGVASMINIERKFYDINTLVGNTQFPGVILTLSAMAQGNDYNQRNGISIKASSLLTRINLYTGTAATGYRVLIYMDMEPRQALPSITDVLEAGNSVSPMNHINGSRFKVLKDYSGTLDPVTNTTKHFKFYRKLGHHIKYTGSSGGITNTDEGNIYCLFLCDSSSGTTSPTALFNSRLRYIDN